MSAERNKEADRIFLMVMVEVTNSRMDSKERMALYREIGIDLLGMAADMGAESK